ncbi:MAG: corrinoid protein [Planctomycetota bacterium]
MADLTALARSLAEGDDETVAQLTQAAISDGVPPKRILDEGLIAGMGTVGERFKAHEIFLPDVLLAARAMNAGMTLLKPLLAKDDVPLVGKVVLGTVQGDLHDIGKNLVGIMLKGAGFEIIDLGSDVAPMQFVEAAKKHEAQVIGMSALLTTTMPKMGEVLELVRQEGLLGKVKTIIGGAPVNKDFAATIKADAYGFDAANAVDCVKRLVGAT